MEVVISSRPRPKPRPVSPGTVAERSPDSDDGFNIGKNRRRLPTRNARRASRLSLTLNPQVPAEASNSVLQPPVEGIPAPGPNLAEDVRMSTANSLEAEEGEEGNLEDGEGRPDSDFERRVLNRVIQLGLDPNDGAVRELLRHGHPGFTIGSDEDGREGHAEERADSAPGEADDQPELEQQPEGLEDEDQGDEKDEEEEGPPPPYELNYNNWTRYGTHGFKIGEQTAVDRLTRYRATGDAMWLPLPPTWVAPRFVDLQQEAEAKLHEKLCFEAGLPPDQHFGAVLDSDKAAQEAVMNKEAKRREVEALKAEATRKERARAREEETLKEQARRGDEAAKQEQAKKDEAGKKERAKQDEGAMREQVGRLEEAAKKGNLLSQKQIQSNLYKLGMAVERTHDQRTPTESDLSGSNYSEAEREARKRREFVGGAVESSSDGGEDEESPLKDKGGGRGNATSLRGKAAASNNKGKGRAALPDVKDGAKAPVITSDSNAKGKVGTAVPGRPSSAQVEKVKALRVEIQERVASLAEEFHARPEAIFRQLGLGGVADMRRVSLVNLYSQTFSLSGGGEGLGRKYFRIYFFLLTALLITCGLCLVDEFKSQMLEQYHTIIKDLGPDEREALKAEWQDCLAAALEEDGKTLSAAARLKRAEKRMLDAVSTLPLSLVAVLTLGVECSARLPLRWIPTPTAPRSL